LISSMIASGRSENRPPHILLLMTSRSRICISGRAGSLPVAAKQHGGS
jgi:hypothetical protein